MIDAGSQYVLQTVLARENASLLNYLGDAFPWTTGKGGATLDEVNRLIRAERSAVSAFAAAFLRLKGTPPTPGSYPAAFTSYNFLSLSFLMPKLLASCEAGVKTLEADVKKVAHPAMREQAEALLTAKRRTVGGLSGLLKPAEPAGAAPEVVPAPTAITAGH